MTIRFNCQECEVRIKVPDGTEGKSVKCPRCGSIQKIPHEEEGLVYAQVDDPSLKLSADAQQDPNLTQALALDTPPDPAEPVAKSPQTSDETDSPDESVNLQEAASQQEDPPAHDSTPESSPDSSSGKPDHATATMAPPLVEEIAAREPQDHHHEDYDPLAALAAAASGPPDAKPNRPPQPGRAETAPPPIRNRPPGRPTATPPNVGHRQPQGNASADPQRFKAPTPDPVHPPQPAGEPFDHGLSGDLAALANAAAQGDGQHTAPAPASPPNEDRPFTKRLAEPRRPIRVNKPDAKPSETEQSDGSALAAAAAALAAAKATPGPVAKPKPAPPVATKPSPPAIPLSPAQSTSSSAIGGDVALTPAPRSPARIQGPATKTRTYSLILISAWMLRLLACFCVVGTVKVALIGTELDWPKTYILLAVLAGAVGVFSVVILAEIALAIREIALHPHTSPPQDAPGS